jgi:hypothetical protein
MVRDLDELLGLMRWVSLKGSPDNPSYRVAKAMECADCGTGTELTDWLGNQAVFGCPRCGRSEAVEVPI